MFSSAPGVNQRIAWSPGYRSITKAVVGSVSCVAIACIRTAGGKAPFTTMTPQAAATATITE